MRLLILILACYRIGQLIPYDKGPFGIFEKLRTVMYDKSNNSDTPEMMVLWENIDDLVSCPYCLGIWVAIILAFFMKPKNIFQYFLYVFAIAGGQNLLQSIGDRK